MLPGPRGRHPLAPFSRWELSVEFPDAFGPVSRLMGPALTDAPLAGDRLARPLGWASLGLGMPPLLRPGGFARALGGDDPARHRMIAAVVGMRELAAGAGLLRWASPSWLLCSVRDLPRYTLNG